MGLSSDQVVQQPHHLLCTVFANARSVIEYSGISNMICARHSAVGANPDFCDMVR